MTLWIIVENGRPVSHPYVEENLIDIDDTFNPINPPQHYKKFIRVLPQTHGPLSKLIQTYKQLDDNTWTDNYEEVSLDPEEKKSVIDDLYSKFEYKGWELDERTMVFKPPVQPPNDGNVYEWDNDTLSWKLYHVQPAGWSWNEEKSAYMPPIPLPLDGNLYLWDNNTLSWVPDSDPPDQTIITAVPTVAFIQV